MFLYILCPPCFVKLAKYAKFALAVIMVSFMLKAALAIIHSPSGDGCWYSSVAKFFGANFGLPAFEHIGREVFSYPFLYPVAAGFAYKFLGIYGMKLLNPLISSVALWLVFLLSRKVAGEKAAFYSVLFVAFLPVVFYHGYIPYLESLSLLLATLSIYLLLRGRWLLSSVSLGLLGLSVQTWFALLPAAAFIILSRDKGFAGVKKLALYVVVACIVISPLWVRNELLFGNPVYPYAVSVFGGPQLPYSTAVHNERLSISLSSFTGFVIRSYLGLFGVPNGEPSNLSFFSFPFFIIIIAAWLLAAFAYLIPFLLGLLKAKLSSFNDRLILVWLLSYLFLAFLLSLVPGFGVHIRYAIPAAAAFGIFSARGFAALEVFFAKRLRVILLYSILALVVLGFCTAEAVKTYSASRMWSFYADDFSWIRNSTPEDALFIAPFDQCYPYYFARPEVGVGDLGFVMKNLNASYAFVNANYRPSGARFSEGQLGIIRGYPVAYNNSRTGTVIYSISQK